MKTLRIDGKTIGKIPARWEDLTPRHVQEICQLSLLPLDKHHFCVSLMLRITGIKLLDKPPITTRDNPPEYLFWASHSRLGSLLISAEDIGWISDCLDFLFSRDERTSRVYIESHLVKNLFPVLSTRTGERLWGPESALYNITFQEWIRLETLYALMGQKPDSEILPMIAGVLYRPREKGVDEQSPDYGGDPRERFSDHLLEERAALCKELHPWQMVYISLFYQGCRAFIIEKHPLTFSRSEGESSGTVFEGYRRLTACLCDGDSTRAPQIRKSLLWDVLPQLENSLEQSRIKHNPKQPAY